MKFYKLYKFGFILFIIFVLTNSGCTKQTPPSTTQVYITYPTNNSYVLGSGYVNIKAEVSGSGFQKLRFYVNDKLIEEDSLYPYECLWDTSYYKHGTSCNIKVEAVDSLGKVIGTSSINCYINIEWTILMYLDGHNDLYEYI